MTPLSLCPKKLAEWLEQTKPDNYYQDIPRMAVNSVIRPAWMADLTFAYNTRFYWSHYFCL